MLHHVEIYVSDLARSVEFWAWLLTELGYREHQRWPKGRSWISGDTYLVLVQAEDRFREPSYHRCHVGLNHLAFHAASREQVDRITEKLRERGAKILYVDKHPHAGGAGSYAVFFEDPDRIKVELVAPGAIPASDRPTRARTEAFASAAAEFCKLVDGAPSLAVPGFCRELARSLSNLCALALDLPEVEPTEREHERAPARPIQVAFGNDDHYREVFDAYSEDEPVLGSLADDLGDIYADLRRGLDVFRGGTEDDARDGAWEWRFSFFSHWGEHATSALRALYWLLRRASEAS